MSILKDPAKGKGSKDQNDLKPKEPTVNDTRIEVRRSALMYTHRGRKIHD